MNFEKQEIALRYWLNGAKFYTASRALKYMRDRHQGLRKDGITPEYAHQIQIASFLRTLVPGLQFPEDTITVGILHDTPEDKNTSFEEIRKLFGERVAHSVAFLTKEHPSYAPAWTDGKLPTKVYYDQLAEDVIASIVKPVDRLFNIFTMCGVYNLDTNRFDIKRPVFKREKQEDYITETESYVLPALKKSRRLFPEQEPAYENVKFNLEAQIALISGILAASL